MKPYLYILSIMALSWLSCNKETSTPTPTAPNLVDSIVNVRNPFDKDIIFIWYDTGSFSLGIDTVLIPANSDKYLPLNKFKRPSHGCFYFWHSTDRTISNRYSVWSNTPSSHYMEIRRDSNTILNLTGVPRNELLIYVNPAGETEWYATDAYSNSGISVWNTLSSSDRNKQINTSWELGSQFKYYHNGAEMPLSIRFDLSTSNFRLSGTVYGSIWHNGHTKFSLSNNMNPDAPSQTNALDTLYLRVNNDSIYYKMYRKP